MPMLESKVNPSAIPRILLAMGWGGILGFESCLLAEFGFGAAIPWYGQAWILVSHLLLGFSVGVAAGCLNWWKFGLMLGLGFSVPSAFGAAALGLGWVPYGTAAITEGLASGLLIAFIVKSLLPTVAADPRRASSTRLCNPGHAEPQECVRYATYQRLAEEKACLEHMAVERECRGNAGFGKTTEYRIVWKELLDLELQDIDEQVAALVKRLEIEHHPPRRRSL